jgi:hypothetical protein
MAHPPVCAVLPGFSHIELRDGSLGAKPERMRDLWLGWLWRLVGSEDRVDADAESPSLKVR